MISEIIFYVKFIQVQHQKSKVTVISEHEQTF